MQINSGLFTHLDFQYFATYNKLLNVCLVVPI